MKDVSAKVKELLSGHLVTMGHTTELEIKDEHLLEDELEFDSLDLVGMLMNLEEVFGREFSVDTFEAEFRTGEFTVGKLIDRVQLTLGDT